MKKAVTALFIVFFLSIFVLIFFFNKTLNQKNVPIETKIGQMIIIGYSEEEKILNSIYDDIENNRVSGIIFYKRSIKSPQKIRKKIDKLNRIHSEYPLFFVVDQEGGLVSRIADDNGFKTYPSAEDIAKEYTSKEAYKIYSNMAIDLYKAGFNFNLAPCSDIKTNPNSVIGKRLRTYGSDAETVSKYSYEFVKAHRDNNIITSLKHFPGLGNAIIDSHNALPDITKSWEKTELEPFKYIISIFSDEPVMVGHVINKKIDTDNISSSSAKTIDLLKNINHKGVVLTDAIDMDAVNNRTIEDIIIDGINAGIDLFIFPNHTYYPDDSKKYMHPELFINIVMNAIKDGKIDTNRIDEAYIKITKLKHNIKRNSYGKIFD